MKAVTGALASLMLLTAVVQAAPTTKPPMGTLSDEDISELLTSWKCPKTGKTLSFHVGVGRQTLNPTKDKSALRKYQKSGEVPFRVTAELIESKERHGKVESTRESGNCYIYILDAEGALVLKKTSSLSKMCPTWGGAGGYFGEVPKEGTYTFVVYVKKSVPGNFGKKLTVKLAAYK